MNKNEIKIPHRPRKKKILWGKIVGFIFILLLLIGSIGYGAFKGYEYLIAKMNVPASAESQGMPVKLEEPIKVYKKEPLHQEDLAQPMYVLTLVKDTQKANELEGIYLVSLNKEQRLIDVIGIPLPSKIMSRDNKSAMPIYEAYRNGGIELTKAIVEDIFHIQIPYFVVFDRTSFEKTMKVLGDTELYVEGNFNQYDESGSDISLIQGVQKMDPYTTWSYFTYESSSESGIEQIQRQERLIKTLIHREYNRWPLTRMVDTGRFWDSLESNISSWDAMCFAFFSRNINESRITYYVLPGAVEQVDGKKYWTINPIDAQSIVGITVSQERN